MIDAVRLGLRPAVPGIWTPGGDVLCLSCHGRSLGGLRELPAAFWDARDHAVNDPSEVGLDGDDATLCDKCDRPMWVRNDVARLHNLVLEVMHQEDADACGAMQQTGGMCAAAVFPVEGGTLVLTNYGMDEAGLEVGFYPGISWETGHIDESFDLLPIKHPDEALSLILTSPPPYRYTLDDEPIDLSEFARVNDLSEEEAVLVERLQPGRTLTFGGGAAAESVLRCLDKEIPCT